jgi:transcriptional regulator with XRE-family HTH domain
MTAGRVTADSPLHQIFAANVYRIRKEQGLTQAGLAARDGFYRRARIGEIESGRYVSDLHTAERCAKALGVTAAELVTFRPGGGGS